MARRFFDVAFSVFIDSAFTALSNEPAAPSVPVPVAL